MSDPTLFIYKISTDAANYVVVAESIPAAEKMITAPIRSVIKLGCVTGDVADDVGSGIVTREWRAAR